MTVHAAIRAAAPQPTPARDCSPASTGHTALDNVVPHDHQSHLGRVRTR